MTSRLGQNDATSLAVDDDATGPFVRHSALELHLGSEPLPNPPENEKRDQGLLQERANPLGSRSRSRGIGSRRVAIW